MNYFRRARLAGAIVAGVLGACTVSAVAGPGHDHGSTPTADAPTSPRLVAESDSYELVGILGDGKLTLYLDRRSDTSPVTAASIELTIDGTTGLAVPQPDGTFIFASPALQKHANHEVVASIAEGNSNDLLVGVLDSLSGQAHGDDDGYDHDHADHHRGDAENSLRTGPAAIKPQSGLPASLDDLRRKLERTPLLAGIALALGLMVGAALRGRTGLMLGIVGLVAVLGAGAAWAGPGHDHGADSAAAFGDAPRRLADGELFLPKPTQRLLAIRTRVLKAETARSADRLIGRVIADPNRSGLVQSTIGGRVTIPSDGLPTLGRPVKKGQVLAYVEPAFTPIDSSDVRQTAGDLAQRIAVLDARIARQRRLVSSGVVNAASLQDLDIERAGLEARRLQLAKSRSEPEALVAPVDGIIAEVRVVAGQVVTSADTLFNIIDPASLWVEAISFDPGIDPAGHSAQARASDGTLLELSFIGRSRALQQQATVLQFKLAAPTEALSIGSPVKVLIEKGAPITGLIVPRGAIAQAPNGQMVAFKRLAPERYLPAAVRIEDLDGERVRVTGGLEPGDQIIVDGAPLVNQIR